MSGALKHFFDQIYYPTLLARIGAPFGFYVHGNTDAAGAVRRIRSITTGLGWRLVHEPVLAVGAVDRPGMNDITEACWDLGATVAATLAAS